MSLKVVHFGRGKLNRVYSFLLEINGNQLSMLPRYIDVAGFLRNL